MSTQSLESAPFIGAAKLLEYWQGHRKLTRRVIEAFPEDQLFRFSVAGMRNFGELANEMLGMAEPMLRGIVTNEWSAFADGKASTREEVLRQWDWTTEALNQLWPQIPVHLFPETITAFEQYTAPVYRQVLYLIDNEIHHRGQGYVYLRALGIEPPPFWEH